ncbi:MFS transporter [Tsuneonella amylolytica]|uniref:MFS transporter n=1 Tax=Tsuneonella amylolytica TaxID=2338327 RepID=UPI000EAA3734|nr:MFS transporter [Tsuneonella amylolytica]
MFAAIAPVRSLLLGIMLLMLGSGFMTSLIGVRLQADGASSLTIGFVATSYFLGLCIGSMRAGLLVQRVGHIRAFAAFVSLLSASTLGYALWQNAGYWTGLRLIDGVCVAGVYVCLESWLNDRAEPATRGSVLAAYMIALYFGQGLGQQLLNVSAAAPALPFVISSLLVSLAVLPIVLTRMAGPDLPPAGMMRLRELYSSSPLGTVGVAVTGIMLGAFYGLAPAYARELGLPVSATASFLTATILGGVALQWPLGLLSDRFDRRQVIIATFAGSAATAGGLWAVGPAGIGTLVAALFGGTAFALYPLCVAHANDRLTSAQRVGATSALVLIYSIGAVCGPLLGSAAMTLAGSNGLFAMMTVGAGLAVAFGVWRTFVAGPVPEHEQYSYQPLPRTTPVAALLDPASEPAEKNRGN